MIETHNEFDAGKGDDESLNDSEAMVSGLDDEHVISNYMELQWELDRLKHELMSLRVQAQSWRAMYEEARASWSWRVTAPLRWLVVLPKIIASGLSSRWSRRIYWAVYQKLFYFHYLNGVAGRIHQSMLMDSDYYLKSNPDVDTAGEDPIWHYSHQGYHEGRNPNAYFDSTYYLEHTPECTRLKMNPLDHYILYGARQQRPTGPGFDTAFYLRENPDVAALRINPLRHFLRYGRFEGRVGSPNQQPMPNIFDVGQVHEDEYRSASAETAIVSETPPAYNFGEPGTGDGPQVPHVPFIESSASHTRLIAFYLPQYHPIPENDAWWGKGFTEWTNVTRAKPAFPGHQQPILPSELGYYDLRVGEIREQQAKLAKEYGVHGFCYYYYWFSGKRLLNRPLDDLLASGKPDFPFCICWANENWTRRWDGLENEILVSQQHSTRSDYEFIKDVIPILKDPRYIKVDGKPLLIVYRAELLKSPRETAAVWRDACNAEGVGEIHLCCVLFRDVNPSEIGFDAAIDFPPHYFPAPEITTQVAGVNPDYRGRILNFAQAALSLIREPRQYSYRCYRGVMPSWDNTARRGRDATMYLGSSPELYAMWLRSAINQPQAEDDIKDNLVFINAWNEWAEGAMLEPSQVHGRRYLEATYYALTDKTRSGNPLDNRPDVAMSDMQVNSQSLDERIKKLVCQNQTLFRLARNNPRITDSVNKVLTHISREKQNNKPIQESLGPLKWKKRPGIRSKSDRKAVVFVSHDAARAGAQMLLLNIVRCFKALDRYEPYIVMLEGGEIEPEFGQVANTVILSQISERTGSKQMALRYLAREVRKLDPIIAICNTVVTSDAASCLKDVGIRVYSLINELVTSVEASLGPERISRIVDASEHVTFVSEFAKRAFMQRFDIPENKLSVNRPGFLPHELSETKREQAPMRFRKKLGIPPSSRIVLGCGTTHPRKGPDLFIQLGKTYLSEHPGNDTFFVWIGGGDPWYVQWCKHDIESTGAADQIKMLAPMDTVEEAFAAADIFALTSREDPFPLVMMEALSRGLPILAFDNAGGAPEILRPDAGIVVPYLDLGRMNRELSKLLEDDTYYARVSASAKEAATGSYTFQHYFDRLVGIVENGMGVEI